MSGSKKIDKIRPETLLQLIRVILETSTDFEYIKGIQPFLMRFAEQKYYVYVKNVSNAYFQDRDNTTRAQLPVRSEFDEIKNSPYPFIFLGYDADNDVLICWNYHIAKKRLNAASSVSFYSRTYFQEEVKPGEFLRRTLKNGDRPVLFKRRDIVEFFSKIDTFFSVNENDNVMGIKPLLNYQEYFEKYFDYTNLSKKTCDNYTRALVGRISDGISHYITHKPIDLFFHNDITTLQNWKVQLFATLEYAELDEVGKKMYSCALEKYIQFHQDLKDGVFCLSDLINTPPVIVESPPIDQEIIGYNVSFIDYLKSQGKTDLLIGKYFDALSNTITKFIYIYISEDVTDIFKIRDIRLLQDWYNSLLMVSEFKQKNLANNNLLSIALGKYIEYLSEVKEVQIEDCNQTPVSVIIEDNLKDHDYEFPYVKNGKLTLLTRPELIEIIQPLMASNRTLAAAQAAGQYYAGQYPSMSLSDWMNLVKRVNFNNSSDVHESIILGNKSISGDKKRKEFILKVTLPDGNTIEEQVVSRTLVRVVEYAGADNVQNIGIMINNVNLVSDTIVPLYERSQKLVGNGLYVMTCCDTNKKLKIIEQISNALELNLVVSKVSVE